MPSVPPPSFQHPGSPPSRPELPEGIERPPLPSAVPPVRRAPLWLPFLIMIGAFAGASVVFALLAVLSGLELDADRTPAGVSLGATLVQDGLLIAGAILAVRVYERGAGPDWFGFRRPALWPAIGWSIVVYLAFGFATALVVLAFGEPQEQQLVESLRNESSTLVLASYCVLICLIAPVAEEVFFRGFMFRVFAARMGILWAALLNGLVFGLVHLTGGPLESGIVLLVLGAGFCLLFWKTGSLLPSMALHAINNSISFGGTLSLRWPLFVAIVLGSTGLVLWMGVIVADRRSAAVAS
jgi:membrane protease YdiL (CAAX protease family)